MQSKTEPTPTGCGGFWIFWKKCRDVVLWCLFIYGQGDHKGSPLRTKPIRCISWQLCNLHWPWHAFCIVHDTHVRASLRGV